MYVNRPLYLRVVGKASPLYLFGVSEASPLYLFRTEISRTEATVVTEGGRFCVLSFGFCVERPAGTYGGIGFQPVSGRSWGNVLRFGSCVLSFEFLRGETC
jgi:hypothetical protein